MRTPTELVLPSQSLPQNQDTCARNDEVQGLPFVPEILYSAHSSYKDSQFGYVDMLDIRIG